MNNHFPPHPESEKNEQKYLKLNLTNPTEPCKHLN